MEDFERLTGVVWAITGFLFVISCLFSRLSKRLGVPVTLLFLFIGMAAGSEGPGGIAFDDFGAAYLFGVLALVVILFAGGLNVHASRLRPSIGPAVTLATVGVLGVATLTAGGAYFMGLKWSQALLIGAIVSSTDAAAVFAVLEGIRLRDRVALTIELESGLNDPMAIILTWAVAQNLLSQEFPGLILILRALWALSVGGAVGYGLGKLAALVYRKYPPPSEALFPTVSVGVALLAYGVPTVIGGSGFLSVYVAGAVLGNSSIPLKDNLRSVHDALAWLAQVGIFLMLGMLVFPSKLIGVWEIGLMIGVFLAFIARPLVASICLLPFKFTWKEILFIAHCGLRGAVPVVIATLPVVTVPEDSPYRADALSVFEIVFFVVVVGSIIPGATVRRMTKLLGLEKPSGPLPAARISIQHSSGRPFAGSEMQFFISDRSPVAGKLLRELELPDSASIALIVRGEELVAPRGATMILKGDHVFVFCSKQCENDMRLMFEGVTR